MTTKDKKLVESAKKVHHTEWYLIDESKADTEEAKEILRELSETLYKKAEYLECYD